MTEPLQPLATQEGLLSLIQSIAPCSEIFLDTEADSLHHYFEKICLIQITFPTLEGFSHALIDPLAPIDLKPFFEVIRSKSIVFHGADYDLRLLSWGYQFTPSSIFDTMLAARLIGQTGLGLDALVLKYTGNQVDHASQKADWSKRPLSPRLLTYALQDTCHLPVIAQNLRQELAAVGRTEWHRQQCDQLISSASGPRKQLQDPWRIKGSFDMGPDQLALLMEIWTWRDAEARDSDLPSFRICHNETLFQWVDWAAKNPGGDFRKGPKITYRWSDRRYRSFSEAIQRAWNLPAAQKPQPLPRTKRPAFDPLFSPRMTRLKAARDLIAKNIGLDPSILAPNSLLESICTRKPTNITELQQTERWLPWQTDLLGDAFLEALNHE